MPSPLTLLARRLGRPAAERGAEAGAATRRTGWEHGTHGVRGRVGPLYTSKKAYELDLDPALYRDLQEAQRRGVESWDLHTHPQSFKDEPVIAPSQFDIDEHLRTPNVGRNTSIVLATPRGGLDSVYGFRYEPRVPWPTQMVWPGIANREMRSIMRRPRFQEDAYDIARDAGADDPLLALEWMRNRLPDVLRPLRLAEPDRLRGEAWHNLAPESDLLSGAEVSPMVDELYRRARRYGYGRGGRV